MSHASDHEEEKLLAAAIVLLESEIGEWGSVSMRLGDEHINAIKIVIRAAKAKGENQ